MLGAARSPFLRSSWWNYLVSGWKYCILCCFLLQARMGLAAAGLPNPYGGQPKKTETAGEKTATEKAEEEFLSAEDSRIMNSPVRLFN